ncbi:MAG: HDIG domain-containing protein [Pirellulaceae bacterium]|nr:HDIG domain-containing protein [Pirellulaceae bacterium]
MNGNGNGKRTRLERVAALELPPNRLQKLSEGLRDRRHIVRLVLVLLSLIVMWGINSGWKPPFPYYIGYTFERDLLSRTDFEVLDLKANRIAEQKVRQQTRYLYENDSTPLLKQRQEVVLKLEKLLMLEEGADSGEVWDQFYSEKIFPDISKNEAYSKFQRLTSKYKLTKEQYEQILHQSLLPLVEQGVFHRQEHSIDEGNQVEISTYVGSEPANTQKVKINEVMASYAGDILRKRIEKALVTFKLGDSDQVSPEMPVDENADHKLQNRGGTERATADIVEDLKGEVPNAGHPLTFENKALFYYSQEGNNENNKGKVKRRSDDGTPLNELLPEETIVSQDYESQPIPSRQLSDENLLGETVVIEREEAAFLASCLYQGMLPLPTTLHWNEVETERKINTEISNISQKKMLYSRGDRLHGIEGKKPLTASDLELLKAEYEALLSNQSWLHFLRYSFANFGMYLTMAAICGAYAYVRNPKILSDDRALFTLIGFIFFVLIGCRVGALFYHWSVEIIPLLLFAMILAIVYQHEMALLLSAVLILIVGLALGHPITFFVVFAVTLCTAILLIERIRSRATLLYVSLIVAVVGSATYVGVASLREVSTIQQLLGEAAWFGFYIFTVGMFLTGVLTVVERIFDVQTDIRLLELGDVSHSLLQELMQRAPGTYNHSMNVASLAEAAAETIGANGLLVRVGAYFHDIGKMLNPTYFIENQSGKDQHQLLAPEMSTLVIIAHVKDGADLARQHHLPKAIIDFIEQHHGTTLVEYFYQQANKRRGEHDDENHVDESTFRYPGPKPQTRETAVLMMADAVESACRTLREPKPARIKTLVHEIIMKKLLDGQFEECDLTFSHIRKIEESLVKSLNAVYHARIKYPSDKHTV